MKRDLSPTQATPAELEQRGPVLNLVTELGTPTPMGDTTYPSQQGQTQPQSTANVLAGTPSPIRFHDEASALYSLVEGYFDNGGEHCERCVHFHELSETCQALEDGMAELCPMSSELIEDEIRANQEDQEGTYGDR